MIAYTVGEMLKKTDSLPDFSQGKTVALLSGEEFDSEVNNIPHKKTMLKFLSQLEYTKAQLFGSCIAGTVCIPEKEGGFKNRICLGFYITENVLFLIGDEQYTVPLLGRMKETQFPENMTMCGLFCRLLNLWIDEDVRYLQKTENSLIEIEEKLLQGEYGNFDEEIFPYRRKMMALLSYYYQLMNLGMTFRSNINQMLCEEDCLNFSYFTGRAERLHIQVQMLRDYMLQMRESYQTEITLRQSKSMNLLTVISAVFLPLTLLAGWYGMNFEFMPELKSPYGYPSVIMAGIIIVAVEIYIFKKKNLF